MADQGEGQRLDASQPGREHEGDDPQTASDHRALDNAICVTLGAYGCDDAAAQQLLEGFVEAHPETGPVVSQDVRHDTLSVVFSVEANSLDEAIDVGRRIFLDGATASDLEPPEAISINASRVDEAERSSDERELQPA